MASSAYVEKIDIGRVIQRGFTTIGRNAATFLVAGLIFSGLPGFVMQYAMVGQVGQVGLAEPQFTSSWATGYGVLFLVSMFASNLLQATLVRSSILDLNGRPADIGGSLQAAFVMILPMIGLTLVIWGALLIAGLIVAAFFAAAPLLGVLAVLGLAVFGVMVFIMWLVAVPVLVEERAGVFGSLSRSTSLTAGSRWRIFGLLVLYVIFWMVVSSVFGMFFAFNPMQNVILVAAVSAASATVTGVFTATMTASLYVELRTVKEGATSDSLAAIFD